MAYVNVAEWKTDQVCEWLKGLENSVLPYVHSFSNHNVNGQQLLNLRPEDLDHLGVSKLGHQEIILEAVEYLRNFHYELDRENLQLLSLRLSCLTHSLFNELSRQTDSQPVSTQTLADVASTVSAVKPLACWLDRPPFSGQLEYNDKKAQLLKLSLEMATCAQRDRFAEKPIEEIRTTCGQMAKLADYIVQDIADPMILQPASLDLATLKKRPGDDLGFCILPSFHGAHQIAEIKFGSAAHQCGKMEEGDEIVQVNYQTVVGWERKNVLELFRESPAEVLLTLKRRPRHTKVYGQIYIKPYRLPSNKKTPYTSRWHHNLPSPRPELLTIPDFTMPLPKHVPKDSPRPQPAMIDTVDMLDNLATDSSDSDSEIEPPSSVRLYLAKPRNTVQRRATITGASPTTKHGIDIERFWRELKQEHSSTFQLRDKAASCAHGLNNVQSNLRPQTCLGIEQRKKRYSKIEEKKVQFNDKNEEKDKGDQKDKSEDNNERSKNDKDKHEKDKNETDKIQNDAENKDRNQRNVKKNKNDDENMNDKLEQHKSEEKKVTNNETLNAEESIDCDIKVPLENLDPDLESDILETMEERRKGKLDKSHSTPAYDLNSEETETTTCHFNKSEENLAKFRDSEQVKIVVGSVVQKIHDIEKHLIKSKVSPPKVPIKKNARESFGKNTSSEDSFSEEKDLSRESSKDKTESSTSYIEDDLQILEQDKKLESTSKEQTENKERTENKKEAENKEPRENEEPRENKEPTENEELTENKEPTENEERIRNKERTENERIRNKERTENERIRNKERAENEPENNLRTRNNEPELELKEESSKQKKAPQVKPRLCPPEPPPRKYFSKPAALNLSQEKPKIPERPSVKKEEILKKDPKDEFPERRQSDKFDCYSDFVDRSVEFIDEPTTPDFKNTTMDSYGYSEIYDTYSEEKVFPYEPFADKFCSRTLNESRTSESRNLDSKHSKEARTPDSRVSNDSRLLDSRNSNESRTLDSRNSNESRIDSRTSNEFRTLDSRSSNEFRDSRVSNESRTLDSRMSNESKLQNRNPMEIQSRSLDSRISNESRMLDSRTLDSRILESRTLDSRILESRTLESRMSNESRGLECRTLDSRNLDSRAEVLDFPDGPGCSKMTLEKPRTLEKDRGVVNRAMMVARSIGFNTSSKTLGSPKSSRKRNIALAKRRNISVKELSPGDLEDWLTYRSRGARGAWAKAWFVLKGSSLFRFKTQDSSKADCLIALAGFTASQATEVKSRKHAFKVYHTGTVFYFAADTEDSLLTWLDAVSKTTVGADAADRSSGLFSETDESDGESKKMKSPDGKDKGFGSLKKGGKKEPSFKEQNLPTGASLDRKYLKFLGKSQNVPVPTAQFRSYRRVLPSSTPRKQDSVSHSPELPVTVAGSTFYGLNASRSANDVPSSSQDMGDYRRTSDRFPRTRRNDELQGFITLEEFMLSRQDEDHRATPSPRFTPLTSDHVHVQHRTFDNLESARMRFVRDIPNNNGVIYGFPKNYDESSSTSGSSYGMQTPSHTFERRGSEKTRDSCETKSSTPRTLNCMRKKKSSDGAYYDSRQENRLNEQQNRTNSPRMGAHGQINPADYGCEYIGNEFRGDRNNSVDLGFSQRRIAKNDVYSGSSGDLASHSTSDTFKVAKATVSRNGSFNLADTRRDKNLDKKVRIDKSKLKHVGQYQPPPILNTPFEQEGMRAAFEMHLDKGEDVHKKNKLKNFFSNKSPQKPSALEIPKETQKTLLGSPRLHRALFRDKSSTQPKMKRSGSQSPGDSGISQSLSSGSASQSQTLSQSYTSVSSVSDWSPDAVPHGSKCSAGQGGCQKRSLNSRNFTSPPTLPYIPPPTSPPPDYPGLEYPPVFEPGTYSLSDASFLRNRNNKNS